MDQAFHDAMQAGYALTEPGLIIGSPMHDGEVDNDARAQVALSMMNRHGLIAGATGTGKTVTLRVLAEQFSALGVPVFMADVKGDLSGLAKEGGGNPKIDERVKSMALDGFTYSGYPVTFWDVFGGAGHRFLPAAQIARAGIIGDHERKQVGADGLLFQQGADVVLADV